MQEFDNSDGTFFKFHDLINYANQCYVSYDYITIRRCTAVAQNDIDV